MKINSSVTLTRYHCHHITLGLEAKKKKKKKKLELTGNLIQSFIPEAHLLTNTVLGKTHGENVLLLLVAIQK